MSKKIAVVSGGFDPIHSGHIELLKNAKKYGDKLIILLNDDEWLIRKKGKAFMPFEERKIIINNLNMVDEVLKFDNDDLGSCIKGLKKIKKLYSSDKIIFCNGGDRGSKNTPEMEIEGIDFKFGIGGEKKLNSSSWILKDWKYYKEERLWGDFFNLFEDDEVKVKELIIHPSKGMSFQKHNFRNEIWLISKGSCFMKSSKADPSETKIYHLKKHDQFNIEIGQWHQAYNESDTPCHIIEIQYGQKTIEEDIERLYLYGEKN